MLEKVDLAKKLNRMEEKKLKKITKEQGDDEDIVDEEAGDKPAVGMLK